jgi:nucleoside phosphorylase
MKVLVVEDDREKLRRVSAALGAVDGVDVEHDVSYVGDVASAARALAETRYDLLVLDIVLPLRVDMAPDAEGGLRLLEEVLERPQFQVPTHVVGLTAHGDAFRAGADRFSERLLTLVQYDPSSEMWARRLQARVRHILMSEAAAQRVGRAAGQGYESLLAVVCALETPELEQVLRLPWQWEQIALPGDYTIYHRGTIPRPCGPVVVHAAASARMGMPAAAVLSMKMIQAFRPQYIAMTGITAGVRTRTNFGDVLAVDPSWDWGSGKVVSPDGADALLAAPHQLPLATDLRYKFARAAQDVALWARIKAGWPAERPAHELAFKLGPVASGASVLADGATAERVTRQHRQLLGIEMETYGVFAAAAEAPEPQPKAFSVKSVVDFADGEKGDRYQPYAAYTSAQALRHIAEHLL